MQEVYVLNSAHIISIDKLKKGIRTLSIIFNR